MRILFVGQVCPTDPFSPKRFPAPFLRRVPALARSPQLRDILSRSPVPCGAPPAGVFPFGRSFCFQGAVHRGTTLGLHEKNAIPGILRELHFDEVYTLELAFLQSFCITRHLKLKCLTLKIKNFKFASNLREDF